MISAEARKQILSNFLEIVGHIADLSYQKRVWIEGRGSEVDDFDEAVCDFFDLWEAVFENYDQYGFTVVQSEKLSAFHKEFERFEDKHDFPDQFIDTPEWGKIVQMANEVLRVFNKSS